MLSGYGVGGGCNNILADDIGTRCTHVTNVRSIWWKCYLDSCATYHPFFMEEFLHDMREGKSTMSGSSNAGTVSTNTKGWYGDFEIWLNKEGIALTS